MKIINRRAFLGAIGVTGAAMLTGCAPEAKSANSADAGAADSIVAWEPTGVNPDVSPMIASPAPIKLSDAEIEEILNNPAIVTTEWVNEDGSIVSPAHQMVRNAINRNGGGMGSLINRDHQLDLWKSLFTEEEAQIYSEMPHYRDFSAAELAQETEREESECLRLCNQIADRGLLRRTYENGKPMFLSLGSEYGYYEAYVQHFDAEFIRLKDLNKSDDFGSGFVDAEFPWYRTLPVSLDVVIDGEYTQWDDWHDIFKRHDKFAVSPCMCRVSTLIREGKGATTQEIMENGIGFDDWPMETCIVTGKQAEYFIEIGAGREITAEEAEAILQHSIDKGMIVDSLCTKEAENICSCQCDCCLYTAGLRKMNGGPALDVASNFNLMHNREKCIGCGMCEKQCPMHSITMDEEGFPVVDSACVRCGQCATVCPQNARGLKLRPEDERREIPENLADYYEKAARARIGKGYLYDITSQEEMNAIAAEVADAKKA